MNKFKLKNLVAIMMAMGLISAQGFAADSALPKKPEVQPEASKSVQPKVDEKTADAAAEKRKELISDAQSAIAETRKALQALEENKDRKAVDADRKSVV